MGEYSRVSISKAEVFLCVGKVLRIDRPGGRRVLRFDGAFGPEGCGIVLWGDEHKVSVTGLTFCVIWHDTHSGDWLTALATHPLNGGGQVTGRRETHSLKSAAKPPPPLAPKARQT